jgi:hypothetical protein
MFYVTEQLGKSQALTPEGFLIVRNAPLARTGLQLYSDKEIPLTGDSDGHVIVQRDPQEVFAPQTVMSLNGKAITMDHPSDNVTPDNWKQLSVGHVINPHRGTGLQDSLLLGDLVLTDPSAIKAVRNGDIRELSVGYDSAYEQTGPGRGRQHNIVCNHLALVETGRCGPVCRIGDSMPRPLQMTLMSKTRKTRHFHIHL